MLEIKSSSYDIVNTEIEFSVHELFISRTDKRGIIQSGNEVFQRISGFTVNELVGSSHNIVRHPDMPKIIFKVLWDSITQNKPIAAYVKNKSKQGGFYWVMAVVFPLDGGYFSIRIKPTSALLPMIKNLYAQLLGIEQIKGIKAAEDFLEEFLHSKGYTNYYQFISTSLGKEVESRTCALLDPLNDHNFGNKKSRYILIRSIQTKIDLSIEMMNKIQPLKSKLRNIENSALAKIKDFLDFSSKIESVATNMSIAAHRSGREGATLAVVANHLQSTLSSLGDLIPNLTDLAQEVRSQCPEILFSLEASMLQCEMVMQCLSEGTQIHGETFQISGKDLKEIIEVARNLVLSASVIIKKFSENSLKLFLLIREFDEKVTKLDLLYSGGRLESSRTNELAIKFKSFLVELQKMVKGFQEPLVDLIGEMKDISNFSLESHRSIQRIDLLLGETLEEINTLSA